MSEVQRFQKGSHSYVKWDKKSKEVRKVDREEKKIQIEIEPREERGAYANLAMISHTKEEVIFDFAFIQPQKPSARVVSRVVMSPAHAKRFVAAAADNIKKYENTFGDIYPVKEAKIGF